MNRRRLDNFRRNRRGAWSLVIFLVLFVASLGAEFLANDKPLIASYKGHLLFPIVVNYPEEMFGGFQATTDYRDPFVADEIKAHGWMIWPPIRFANSTTILDPPTPLPTPPTWAADRRAMPHGAREAEGRRRRDRPASVLASSNRCGSAPTRTGTTSSPACSTASASRCCSA